MSDWSWTQARINDAVGNVEAAALDTIQEARRAVQAIAALVSSVGVSLAPIVQLTVKRLQSDPRQAFLDRAAIWAPHDDPAQAYQFAEDLWAEREERRCRPQERELVVRWLRFQGQGQPEEKRSTYEAIADAIKAGKHVTTLADIREKIRGFQDG